MHVAAVSVDLCLEFMYLVEHHTTAHLTVPAVRAPGALQPPVGIPHVDREIAEEGLSVRRDVGRVGHLVDLSILELESQDILRFDE